LAGAAFVGGSLAPLGGQNFLEPLMYGVIPVTGPSWYNFYWIGRQIIDLGLVRMTEDWKSAAEILIKMLHAPVPPENVRNKAFDFVRKRRGGTRKACEAIHRYIA
jgi:3-deoxy-D-manno-octulosonic-acid transferase